jgi:ATP synthase protein I
MPRLVNQVVTSSEPSPEATSASVESTGNLPPDPDPSMQEYYKLQAELLVTTLVMAGIVFVSVWIFYSFNTALNYLIGAVVGMVYLRMLARNVADLGRGRKKLGSARLALLIGLILIASRLDQLEILPIFLGFLTYKIAVIFYMLRSTFIPDTN